MKGDQKRHQLGAQIEVAEKGQQVADQLEMPESFGKVPWFHHVQIFCHCGTLDEALFYINKVVEEGWSRSWLEDQIAAKLFLNSLRGTWVTKRRTLNHLSQRLQLVSVTHDFKFEAPDGKQRFADALDSDCVQTLAKAAS